MSGLEAEVRVGLDRFRLELDLRVPAGEVLAVLGPNGAGKSSLLRCVAGLLPLDEGYLRLDDEDLDRPAAGRFLPPERRRVGYCFQDYRLFPHLDLLQNVAFGPQARGMPRARAEAEARAWLERVGMAHLAAGRPGRLSGGQAQRVALARALATQPAVLLLDEPLAALDREAARDIRRLLAELLADFPGQTLLVSHQPLDTVALADRILVLAEGRIRQEGRLGELQAGDGATAPELLDQNWLRGRLAGGQLHVDGGLTLACAQTGLDGPVYATIRPQAITLHLTHPEGSARNVLQAPIEAIHHRPDGLRLRLGPPLGLWCQITPEAQAALALAPGKVVWAAIKASEVVCVAR